MLPNLIFVVSLPPATTIPSLPLLFQLFPLLFEFVVADLVSLGLLFLTILSPFLPIFASLLLFFAICPTLPAAPREPIFSPSA